MTLSKSRRLRNKRRFTGQFQCQCGHSWTAYELKIQNCEQCRVCGTDVFPTLLCLETEIDTNCFEAKPSVKYFGQYQCFKCLRTWFSAHAWMGFAQQCRKCQTWTEAHKLRQLIKPKGMDKRNDPKKPHESEMCGKCRVIGHNCTTYQKVLKMFGNLKI